MVGACGIINFSVLLQLDAARNKSFLFLHFSLTKTRNHICISICSFSVLTVLMKSVE
jgi:hypothetical protein